MRGFHVLAGILAFLLPALLAVPTAAGTAQADAVLVLAIDVSDSIDDEEFRMQIEGTAEALTHADVIAAIRSGPIGRVAMSYLIWAEDKAPKLTGAWHMVSDLESAGRLAAELRRQPRTIGGTTGLGAAISAATAHLRSSGVASTRFIIDLSGDGRDTRGRRGLSSVELRSTRKLAARLGITINCLAIETTEPGLAAWYLNRVAVGPGHFVMRAGSLGEYGTAIRRKLIRELTGSPLIAAR
jgi:hypothetical protein